MAQFYFNSNAKYKTQSIIIKIHVKLIKEPRIRELQHITEGNITLSTL